MVTCGVSGVGTTVAVGVAVGVGVLVGGIMVAVGVYVGGAVATKVGVNGEPGAAASGK